MEHIPSKHGVYFLEIELENVRCFGEKTKIDLRDPKDNTKPARWTVLIGENGVGKTTVLRSLVSVGPFPTNAFTDWGGDPSYLEHWSSLWKISSSGKTRGSLSAILLQGNGNSIVTRISYDEEGPEHEQDRRSGGGDAVCLAYGASRHMGTQGIEEDPLKNASLSLFKDNAELTNASELFHQTYITAQKEGDPLLHDTLKSIILSVLPGITDIRTAKGSGFSWRAEVLTPYGWVWIHDLSLGYKTMVAWIVDFASKLFLLYPNSPNPLAEPAVCLVDEIDLHMHPTWQRKIMGFLTDKFPNTQFIVTAHSPLMVQAAAEANIVLLKREGDHVVVDNDPIVVKNWSVDQILASVFGVSGRSEATDKNMERRRALLAKSVRNDAEDRELESLETELVGYSHLRSPEELEAASLLRELAGIVREKKKGEGK